MPDKTSLDVSVTEKSSGTGKKVAKNLAFIVGLKGSQASSQFSAGLKKSQKKKKSKLKLPIGVYPTTGD